MSVRISATDWAGDDGVTPDDAVEIARAFAEAGADLIDVSAGQTWADAKPVYGRMFQTPFSDKIRNEAKLATMAVGNITEADQANAILASGRADLVALARPHLIDPSWTLRAAAAAGYRDIFVPAALPRRDGAAGPHHAARGGDAGCRAQGLATASAACTRFAIRHGRQFLPVRPARPRPINGGDGGDPLGAGRGPC